VLKRDASDPIVFSEVISMGESGVGKSCIIKRYCEEQALIRNPLCCTFARELRPMVMEPMLTPDPNLTLSHPQFVPRYISTIGVDFGVKPMTVDG